MLRGGTIIARYSAMKKLISAWFSRFSSPEDDVQEEKEAREAALSRKAWQSDMAYLKTILRELGAPRLPNAG
jgi:hypothetical protein